MQSIFDPQFNGIPNITHYRGDVDPSLAGGDHRRVRWENWPPEELEIFNKKEFDRLYGTD